MYQFCVEPGKIKKHPPRPIQPRMWSQASPDANSSDVESGILDAGSSDWDVELGILDADSADRDVKSGILDADSASSRGADSALSSRQRRIDLLLFKRHQICLRPLIPQFVFFFF